MYGLRASLFPIYIMLEGTIEDLNLIMYESESTYLIVILLSSLDFCLKGFLSLDTSKEGVHKILHSGGGRILARSSSGVSSSSIPLSINCLIKL